MVQTGVQLMLIVLDSANNTGGVPSQLFNVIGMYLELRCYPSNFFAIIL